MQVRENDEPEITKRVGWKKSSSELSVQNHLPHLYQPKNKTERSRIFFLIVLRCLKVDSENRMRCDLMRTNIYPKNKTERSPIFFFEFFQK